MHRRDDSAKSLVRYTDYTSTCFHFGLGQLNTAVTGGSVDLCRLRVAGLRYQKILRRAQTQCFIVRTIFGAITVYFLPGSSVRFFAKNGRTFVSSRSCTLLMCVPSKVSNVWGIPKSEST